MAGVLATIGRMLDDEPLARHPLFSPWQHTFRRGYTLQATSFQRDHGSDWARMLRSGDDSVLPLPQTPANTILTLLEELLHTVAVACVVVGYSSVVTWPPRSTLLHTPRCQCFD